MSYNCNKGKASSCLCNQGFKMDIQAHYLTNTHNGVHTLAVTNTVVYSFNYNHYDSSTQHFSRFADPTLSLCISVRLIRFSAWQHLSPLPHRPASSLDHIVASGAPGDVLEKSQCRIALVPFARATQQCIPAPSCPLQRGQSLPCIHRHQHHRVSTCKCRNTPAILSVSSAPHCSHKPSSHSPLCYSSVHTPVLIGSPPYHPIVFPFGFFKRDLW